MFYIWNISIGCFFISNMSIGCFLSQLKPLVFFFPLMPPNIASCERVEKNPLSSCLYILWQNVGIFSFNILWKSSKSPVLYHRHKVAKYRIYSDNILWEASDNLVIFIHIIVIQRYFLFQYFVKSFKKKKKTPSSFLHICWLNIGIFCDNILWKVSKNPVLFFPHILAEHRYFLILFCEKDFKTLSCVLHVSWLNLVIFCDNFCVWHAFKNHILFYTCTLV